jgi:hypothetical protein
MQLYFFYPTIFYAFGHNENTAQKWAESCFNTTNTYSTAKQIFTVNTIFSYFTLAFSYESSLGHVESTNYFLISVLK